MSIPAEVQEYLKGPSCPPPEGQTSNQENPPNRNIEAFVFAVLCIVLVTTTTIARAYSRICLVKQFHVEDYLGIGAIIPFSSFVFTYFYFARQIGFFVQQWDLPGSVLIDSGYISLITAISYGLLMLLLKTAIILEWIRIFVPHRTRNIFYWSSVILILMNSGFYIASIAVTFGNCRPLEKLWHFWVPGTCIKSRGRDIASGAINLALDVFILALPQRIIWTLKMNARRKIGIAVVFSIGLLVVATAIGRVQTILNMDYPDLEDTVKPFNTSYKSSQARLWELSEITCIFLVFCVPALPRLFEDRVIFSRVTVSWRPWMRIPQQAGLKVATEGHSPNNTGNHSELQCRSESPNHMEAAYEPSMEHFAGSDHQTFPGTGSLEAATFDTGEESASKTSMDSHTKSQEPWMAPNV